MWDLGNGWMSGVLVMLSLSEVGAGALSVCDPFGPPHPSPLPRWGEGILLNRSFPSVMGGVLGMG